MANILKMQELSKLRLSFYGADFIDLFDLVAYLPNLVELFLVLNKSVLTISMDSKKFIVGIVRESLLFPKVFFLQVIT